MKDTKEQVAFNKLIVVAKRYSKALVKLAKDDNELNEIYSNLILVSETIESCNELQIFLSHPSISKEEKKEVLKEIFSQQISQNVLNFLYILMDRNRVFALNAIIHSLKALIDEKYNLVTIKAISAVEISEELKQKLKGKLESIYQKEIQLETSTDENLIAGMVLKIGDKIIDGSVKSKLDNMKKELIKK